MKLSEVDPPHKYHDNEDRLAEHVRDNSGWKIRKVKRRWIGVPCESVLEQGEVQDIDQKNLVLAAAGKIKAAVDRGQLHVDLQRNMGQYSRSFAFKIEPLNQSHFQYCRGS